jgi:hypothetical protein
MLGYLMLSTLTPSLMHHMSISIDTLYLGLYQCLSHSTCNVDYSPILAQKHEKVDNI